MMIWLKVVEVRAAVGSCETVTVSGSKYGRDDTCNRYARELCASKSSCPH